MYSHCPTQVPWGTQSAGTPLHLSVLASGEERRAGCKGSNRLPRLYLRRRLLYVIKQRGSLRALSPLSNQKHYVSRAAFGILQQPVGWLVQECASMGAIEKIPAAVVGCGSFRWKGSFVPCGHPKWEFGERQKWLEGTAHVHGDQKTT